MWILFRQAALKNNEVLPKLPIIVSFSGISWENLILSVLENVMLLK